MLFDDGMSLDQFGAYLDEAGRAWSPFLERGETGIPELARVPSPHELTVPRTPEQSAEMDRLVHRYMNGRTPDVEMKARAQFLTRYGITPGDPRWAVEQDRLMNGQRGRIQVGMARRLTERYETLSAAGGDMAAMTIYIAEGDDPCEECIALAGEEMPLGERIAEGLMPGDRCLGGDACQCGIGVVG